MEGNIFEKRKERELQRLRQQLASNVVKVDPNLKGYLDRFDPDVSRATLLRLQRQKIPTKEELEKLAGVKTAKKLKGRRTKDLRGEVGRAIREQKRFEKGERRYRPEEEPRIVGEPAPQPVGQAGFHYDPEVEKEKIRVMALGQLQTARIANKRLELEARQLEINKQLSDRERGERQRQFNIENRRSEEQLALEHRQLDALLDRQQDDRERFEEDIRQRQKERKLQRELQARALETKEFKTQTIAQQGEQEKRLRELEITKRDVIEAEKLRVHDELKSRELDLLERRLDLDRERARGEAGGLSQADRDFLQRGFQQGLETLERRFGENEARIQEQIRTHADRVGQQQQTEGSLRQPVEIKLVQPEQTGPTAQEIAIGVREALKEYKKQGSPRRRLEIEEVSEEEEPIAELLESPRPAPVQTPTQSPRPLKKAEPTPLTAEEIAQPLEQGLFESAELVDPRNLPQEGFPETERREPEPEQREPSAEPQGELFESGFFAGGLEAAAQNAIGFVGDAAGRAAEGIAGLLKPEIGEQTGGRLDPEGQVFGLGQEIEVPRPTIQDVPSAEPQRRPPAQVETSERLNLTPGRMSINRDILESQIQQNSERYKTEFADKFDEERERLRQAWLEQYFSKRPKLEEEKKELIRSAVYNPEAVYKPGFDPNKYWKQANSYIETNRNKELLAKSEKYKTELLRQRSLLRDVDERIKKKNFKFTDPEGARIYFNSLTENKPEKILKGPPVLPPKKSPPPRPPQAAGVVEEVEEEEQEKQALEEGEGLLEEEVQAVIQPSEMNTNLRLFESIEPEIDAHYTRGRATGGARGDLPFMITNITDKTYKGLAPGQSVVISQIEKDGKLGYFPGSRIRGEKVGITRIGREVLRKQIKSGKLKVDRIR